MTMNKNVPKIRFKGFSEEWEEMPFSETFLSLNNNTLSRADLNYELGNTCNIHYGDILIKFGECIDVEQTQLPYITDEKKVDKIIRLASGDIVFADTAEDETAGKCVEVLNITNQQIVAGLHTIACRPRISFSNRYLGYFLNSPAFHDQLLVLMQGTKVVGISKSAIQSTEVRYPTNNTEQAHIGNFFQNIDNLIHLKQKKLDKLKNFKKASLEKMFPKKGATTPQIRFKGFSGEWKEKKLGEIVQYENGKAHEQDICEEGEYIVVNSKFISTEGAVKKFSNTTFCLASQGDILMVLSDVPNGRAIAKCFLVNTNNKYTVNQRICKLSSIVADTCFLYFLINRNTYFLQFDDGVKQTNLRKDDVLALPLRIPTDLKEQEQIATYLKTLDGLISESATKLTQLKNIKKACLDKMFVTKE